MSAGSLVGCSSPPGCRDPTPFGTSARHGPRRAIYRRTARAVMSGDEPLPVRAGCAHVGLQTNVEERKTSCAPVMPSGGRGMCPRYIVSSSFAGCFILNAYTCDVSRRRLDFPERRYSHHLATAHAGPTCPARDSKARVVLPSIRQPAVVARGELSRGSGRRGSISRGSGRAPSEGRRPRRGCNETLRAGQVAISAVVHETAPRTAPTGRQHLKCSRKSYHVSISSRYGS